MFHLQLQMVSIKSKSLNFFEIQGFTFFMQNRAVIYFSFLPFLVDSYFGISYIVPQSVFS